MATKKAKTKMVPANNPRTLQKDPEITFNASESEKLMSSQEGTVAPAKPTVKVRAGRRESPEEAKAYAETVSKANARGGLGKA